MPSSAAPAEQLELATIHLVGFEAAPIPHLQQYFGPWAMCEEHLLGIAQRLQGYDVQAHVLRVQQEAQAADGEGGSRAKLSVTPEGIAVIPIRGMLMKQESSFGSNTSTVVARRQVRAALANSDVKGIMLAIESPGGTVAGTKELASDIATAAASKPVWAYAEDLCASAAYWLAAQATRISANDMASVGSIGTYGVINDYSGYAAKEGIKVHVVKAGDFKGMGQPGTEVTGKQLAYYQDMITQINEHFLAGVAAGRKMPIDAVRALADGRTHLASNAQGIGLIDAVESFDSAMNQFKALVSKPVKGTSRMSTEVKAADAVATLQPQIASLDEITAACPGADDTFVLSQLRVKATVDQAKNAWMKHLADANAALAKANAELKAKEQTEASAATKKPGVQPVHAGATAREATEDDPLAAFDAAVAVEMKSGKSRAVAHAAVCRKYPELRNAMVAAHNAMHGASRR